MMNALKEHNNGAFFEEISRDLYRACCVNVLPFLTASLVFFLLFLYLYLSTGGGIMDGFCVEVGSGC